MKAMGSSCDKSDKFVQKRSDISDIYGRNTHLSTANVGHEHLTLQLKYSISVVLEIASALKKKHEKITEEL